jgi:K+-transporting ATPase KdpF subunit
MRGRAAAKTGVLSGPGVKRASEEGGAIVPPVELIGNIVAGVIAAGLLVYLVFVLIQPERF